MKDNTCLLVHLYPNFYIRKHRPHSHRYGKAPGCKDYFTANQLAKKCRKKKYDSINDRYIRDKTFSKAMIEVGRSEKIIKEMDQLVSEEHTKPLKKRLIFAVAIGGFTLMWHTSIWYQQGTNLISKRRCRQCTASSKWGTKRNMPHGRTILPLLLGNGMQAGGSLILSARLKNGMTTDSTGQPRSLVVRYLFAERVSTCREFRIFIVNKSVTSDGSLLSPTWGVNGIQLAPEIHEQFMIHKGYGTLRISSRTTSTTLSAV